MTENKTWKLVGKVQSMSTRVASDFATTLRFYLDDSEFEITDWLDANCKGFYLVNMAMEVNVTQEWVAEFTFNNLDDALKFKLAFGEALLDQ